MNIDAEAVLLAVGVQNVFPKIQRNLTNDGLFCGIMMNNFERFGLLACGFCDAARAVGAVNIMKLERTVWLKIKP